LRTKESNWLPTSKGIKIASATLNEFIQALKKASKELGKDIEKPV
jgi:hypothetical protein